MNERKKELSEEGIEEGMNGERREGRTEGIKKLRKEGRTEWKRE